MKKLAALVILSTLVLAGCGDGEDPGDAGSSATTSATPAASGTAQPTESASATSTQTPTRAPTEPSEEPSTASTGASAGEVLEPTQNLLAWEDTGVAATERVTKGGPWTLTVDEAGSLARIEGPKSWTVSGSKRFSIKDAFLSASADGAGFAVVVLSDTLEEQPARATVFDLGSGTKFRIRPQSDPPPATGGSWALGGSTLAYPVTEDDGSYCLMVAELQGSEPSIAWCAEPREGFNNVRIAPAGITAMSFDDARPSCRTVGSVYDGFTPLQQPTKCKAWEMVGFESLVAWTEVPNEKQIDAAHAYAAGADARYDLGPATSGTLTPCGGAAYWVRDPQGNDEPARLMRLNDAGGLEIVYESASVGNAFLSAPRCGGDRITLTAFGDQGDQQVSAPLGG